MDKTLVETARRVVSLCALHELTLSFAESCTGGLISAAVTAIPGCSEVFKGGIVAYSNEIKQRELGVPKELLEKEGAVSEACAHEMVLGCLDIFKTDIAAAVTGIAGPGGGSEDKPVGLVYIGRADKNNIIVNRFRFNGDRDEIRLKTAQCALDSILIMLKRRYGLE